MAPHSTVFLLCHGRGAYLEDDVRVNLSYKVTQIVQHHHRNRFQKFGVKIEINYKADVILTKYTIQSR